jgi:hypothetical protein
MSHPTVSEDCPDNRNKLSHSDTTENTLQLSKIILNQKGTSALDVGQKLQGLNVYILSPTQLKDIGLVTKMSNGRPIIMQENKDGSRAEVVSSSQLVPLLQTQKISPETVVPDQTIATDSGVPQEVAGISHKAQSIRGSAIIRENKERSPQCLKMPGGVKRKRPDEADGNMQKGQDKVRLLANLLRPIWKGLFFFLFVAQVVHVRRPKII